MSLAKIVRHLDSDGRRLKATELTRCALTEDLVCPGFLVFGRFGKAYGRLMWYLLASFVEKVVDSAVGRWVFRPGSCGLAQCASEIIELLFALQMLEFMRQLGLRLHDGHLLRERLPLNHLFVLGKLQSDTS
jgi:hypothetical protein